jgi:hypothetical protein
MVELARQLRRPDPDHRPVPLRKVAAALAERGYVASTDTRLRPWPHLPPRRGESDCVQAAGAVLQRMRAARKAQAAQFAANVAPIIREIQAAGHSSFNAWAG